MHIGLIELAAVREVAARVGRVVIHQDDADAAGGLEEGEEGVILVGFAAVDEGKFSLCLHEAGVGVLVERIRVGREFIHECQGVGLGYDGGDIGDDTGNFGDEWECGAKFVENVRGGAEDITWEH